MCKILMSIVCIIQSDPGLGYPTNQENLQIAKRANTHFEDCQTGGKTLRGFHVKATSTKIVTEIIT